MPARAPQRPGQVTFDVFDGRLVVTVHPDALRVCRACPDLHVDILERGTAANIRDLAAGLVRLAGHVKDEDD